MFDSSAVFKVFSSGFGGNTAVGVDGFRPERVRSDRSGFAHFALRTPLLTCVDDTTNTVLTRFGTMGHPVDS